MTELVLTRLPTGALAPADGPSADYIGRMKLGAAVRGKFVKARNITQHRRMWVLFTFAFDQWDAPELEYQGKAVAKNLDRFRRDLTILAGYYEAVTNLKGEVRLEAKSIAFDRMEQDEFDLLYRAILNLVWDRILKSKGYASPEAVEAILEELLRFD